jgi:hypothetical protein
MGNVVNTRSGVGGENVVDFIELRVVKGVATGNGTRTKYMGREHQELALLVGHCGTKRCTVRGTTHVAVRLEKSSCQEVM